MAAQVSPIEAVRYTEGGNHETPSQKRAARASPLLHGLGQPGPQPGQDGGHRPLLSLAVVLLTVTVTFTQGFDMDKYVSNFTASDFIVADAGQFQTGGDAYNDEMDVPEDVIAAIDAQGGITGGGLVYGKTSAALEFVTEGYYRSVWSRWNTPSSWTAWSASRTAMRGACWPTGCSSTAWSSSPGPPDGAGGRPVQAQ